MTLKYWILFNIKVWCLLVTLTGIICWIIGTDLFCFLKFLIPITVFNLVYVLEYALGFGTTGTIVKFVNEQKIKSQADQTDQKNQQAKTIKGELTKEINKQSSSNRQNRFDES